MRVLRQGEEIGCGSVFKVLTNAAYVKGVPKDKFPGVVAGQIKIGKNSVMKY